MLRAVKSAQHITLSQGGFFVYLSCPLEVRGMGSVKSPDKTSVVLIALCSFRGFLF